MPIYGYRCTQCNHEFEIVQRMVDEPLKTCPECMGLLQKQLYPAGIVFKGSGFYKTDYASASSKSTEGSSSTDGGGSEAGKSDSAKSDSTKPDSGKSDSAKSDSGKSEGPSKEAPKKESKAESAGSKE